MALPGFSREARENAIVRWNMEGPLGATPGATIDQRFGEAGIRAVELRAAAIREQQYTRQARLTGASAIEGAAS